MLSKYTLQFQLVAFSKIYTNLYVLFYLFRYVDKFTEFISSFVKSHLRRFECNSQFPIIPFLSLLFKYTFEQQRQESYLSCLQIWCSYVDYVTGLISSRSLSEPETTLIKYREAFHSLTLQVIKEMQFRVNAKNLEELDNETIDDDVSSCLFKNIP